jgi:predicted patatin/cPLA2 family phospholipase
MQEKHLYEYAVIRVVPRVEREEFLNVGIVLFCKKAKFIKMLYAVNETKLQLFSDDFDIEQLNLNLQSFQKIANGAKDGGPIAQFDIPSRFRWLTAIRSSAIQTSRPHPGICGDLEGAIQRLFEEMVL